MTRYRRALVRHPPGGPRPADLQIRRASSNLSGHCNRQTLHCQRTGRGGYALYRRANVDIDVRAQGAVRIVKLKGRLTLGESVDALRKTIEELFQAGDSRFVVDLGEVQMVDSSGIGLLVKLLTTAKQKGGSLKLLNPSKFAVQTLKMIGLLNLFEVFDNQADAVASFA